MEAASWTCLAMYLAWSSGSWLASHSRIVISCRRRYYIVLSRALGDRMDCDFASLNQRPALRDFRRPVWSIPFTRQPMAEIGAPLQA
ncbi:hypothetical protein ACVINW_003943 [Bradyrhizobium sp. USDA 4461]